MKPYLYLGGALVAIAMLAAAYLFGRSDGKAIEVAAQARVEAAVKVEREQRETKLDLVGGAAATKETARVENVREIYRESHTITERPVYRNVCVDADGMRLLDQAANVANGEDPGGAAAGTGKTPQGAP